VVGVYPPETEYPLLEADPAAVLPTEPALTVLLGPERLPPPLVICDELMESEWTNGIIEIRINDAMAYDKNVVCFFM
jgi:hypothetical protein